MQIWVDGDACPTEIKELLCRTAVRRKIRVTFVANQTMNVPRSEFVDCVTVPTVMNSADRRIVELVGPGDLVITSDIPLAAEVVKRDALALSHRGEGYSPENIGERLAMRNMMDDMRGSGQIVTGGPSRYDAKQKQEFANQLDRFITKGNASRERG